MAIATEIKSLLISQLMSAANLPPIEQDNIEHKEDGEPYLDQSIIFSNGDPISLSVDPDMRYSGLFRVIIHAEKNKGEQAKEGIISEIKKVFVISESYTFGSSTIQIMGVDERSQLPNNVYYSVPLEIRWMSL